MHFSKVKKKCMFCGKLLKLNNYRDIDRKKYCSRSHRQKIRYIIEPAFRKMFLAKAIPAGSSPVANKKKGRPGSLNGRFVHDRSLVKWRLRPETNAFRAAVFERDGHQCIWCGSRRNLVADHIKSYAIYPRLRYKPSNGRTLCNSCHKKTDTYGGKTVKLKREVSHSIPK